MSCEANDAVSAYTQVKMNDAPVCSAFRRRSVQHFGSGFLDIVVQNMFPVERNRHGHPLAGLLWEENWKEIP